MNTQIYNSLQIREIFHLEFMRLFTRKLTKGNYALKGGSNLRFYFGSIRYSEDMDLDIEGVEIFALKDTVMQILSNPGLAQTMKSYGVLDIIPPDISKAKQTQTTQRFKVHLITAAKEELFTKIEFSKRGLKKGIIAETVSGEVLRMYKMTPLIIKHYGIEAAITQKIYALAVRAVIQARDVFDIYMLSGKVNPKQDMNEIEASILKKAFDNAFSISYEEFNGAVLSYLTEEDRKVYGSPGVWDDIKSKVSGLLEGRSTNAEK